MDLTPSSDDIDGSDGDDDSGDADDEPSDTSDPDAGDSENGGFEGSGTGSVEPVELSAEEEAYRDDLLAAIEVDDDDAGFDMACLTGRWIQVAGLERLDAEGVTPEVFAEEGPTAIDLGRDDALEFARAYERCGMDLHDFLLPEDLDPTLRACITDALDRSVVEDYVVLAIQGNDEQAQAMQDEISAATSHCTE